VPIEEVDATGGSLKLVAVSRGLQLHVYRPGEAFGNPKRRVQAKFSYNGVSYRLWVTDPLIETEHLTRGEGVHALGPSYLTISLGEPLDGRCYKLVAAIIGARA
jgi:Dual OB-containing domain